MPELIDIDELTEGLDAQARAVVLLIHGMVQRLEVTIEKLQAENAELKRMLFGKSSERRVMPPVNREVAKRVRASETPEEKAKRDLAAKKRRADRKKARKELPAVEAHIPVPEDEKVCASCGSDFRPLGEGLVTDQYEYVPARLVKNFGANQDGRTHACQY